MNHYEQVNGVVLGPFTSPYEFWTTDDAPKIIGQGKHFENDEKAVAWFKETYPVEFSQGVEMRCFEN